MPLTLIDNPLLGPQYLGWLSPSIGVPPHRFYLTNHRVPIIASYLRGTSWYNAEIITNVTIPNESPNIPMQLNLAVTDKPDAYRVTWSVRDTFPGGVRWGLSEGSLTNSSNSAQQTFGPSDLCGGLTASTTGWASPGMINSAIISGLEPNTRYYYQVGFIRDQHYVLPPARYSRVINGLHTDHWLSSPFTRYFATVNQISLSIHADYFPLYMGMPIIFPPSCTRLEVRPRVTATSSASSHRALTQSTCWPGPIREPTILILRGGNHVVTWYQNHHHGGFTLRDKQSNHIYY